MSQNLPEKLRAIEDVGIWVIRTINDASIYYGYRPVITCDIAENGVEVEIEARFSPDCLILVNVLLTN